MPAILISKRLKRNSGKSSLIRNLVYKFRRIPIALIAVYQQFISPFWPPSCRFYPTCSTYARHAISKYGFIKGSFLALIRISKCHPFHRGGYDPLL